ncbi:MAG: cytochrome C, partial [Deltaproteobacteria bacterium]|nr:cytochrome C [Deltaproteobacteria bacterium]
PNFVFGPTSRDNVRQGTGGVSYQGLMESAFATPFRDDGSEQPKLHGKNYSHLKEDVHLRKGMLCQDCHTSNDVHGDGLLVGTTLAAVEIECQDCHGNTRQFPWELPLGYGDEHDTEPASGPPRGLAQKLISIQKQGTVHPPRDGYLITARGNPMPQAVKDGEKVILHLASGKDIELKPLKSLMHNNQIHEKGAVAMHHIEAHEKKMECYACHSTWAPQCYGCHINVDYKPGYKHSDWVAMGDAHDLNGRTADQRKSFAKYFIDGKVTENRAYLRWEDPPLAQNGEGRVSPTIPGCQTTVSVRAKDGHMLLKDHIFRIPNVEGAGPEGQLAIDMSPVQPHTIQKEARSCETCHANPKAMGYGINGGTDVADQTKPFFADLKTADGQLLTRFPDVQLGGIANLAMDWSRFLSETGQQLQTVDHHYKLAGPLSPAQIAKLDRRGICLSCHQMVPHGDLAAGLISHVAKTAGLVIDQKMHDKIVNKAIQISAMAQVLLGAGAMSFFGVLLCFSRIRNRCKTAVFSKIQRLLQFLRSIFRRDLTEF